MVAFVVEVVAGETLKRREIAPVIHRCRVQTFNLVLLNLQAMSWDLCYKFIHSWCKEGEGLMQYTYDMV